MYIKNDYALKPFITGGGQERGMRSGTENVHGIAGIALALSLYQENRNEKYQIINALKSKFKSLLSEAFPEISFIEDINPTKSIATILSVSFPENPKTELMTFNLDIAGISASAGSACASGVENTSHVLAAVHFPEDRRAVRFSFSYFNTEDEVRSCVEKIINIFKS
jgi:cysteine desulfurase